MNKRRSKSRILHVVAFALLAACGRTQAEGRSASAGEPSTTTVDARAVVMPVVVNLDQTEAKRVVSAAGLEVQMMTAPSDTVPVGAVVSSYPSAGTATKAGKKVLLVISNGPETVTTITTVPPAPPTTAAPPPPPPTAPPAPTTWYPAGFKPYGGGIAYRFLERGQFRCDLPGTTCWGIEVVTRYGCDSVYVTINVIDSAGRVIDDAIDSLNNLPAGRIGVLKPFTTSSGVSSGRLAEINCF